MCVCVYKCILFYNEKLFRRVQYQTKHISISCTSIYDYEICMYN